MFVPGLGLSISSSHSSLFFLKTSYGLTLPLVQVPTEMLGSKKCLLSALYIRTLPVLIIYPPICPIFCIALIAT